MERESVRIYLLSDIVSYRVDDQMHFIFVLLDKTIVFIRMMLFSLITLLHNYNVEFTSPGLFG